MSVSNQQPNYAPTEAGLPDSESYDPDANRGVNISAGEPEQVWDQYGLAMLPVLHDGEDTGRRHIVRNGQFLATVTENYKLLPNEEVVSIANDVARDVGLRPFHEFDGDWYVSLDDHVYQDPERRRVHALYAWDEPFTVGDDEMHYGVAVHNSVDSSLSFQVGLFSFRHACSNMVTMTVKNLQADTFDTGQFDARNVEEEREVVDHDARKHTSGFDISEEALRARILTTASPIENGLLNDTYEEWRQEAVKPEVVEGLLSRAESGSIAYGDLPEWVDQVREAIDAASEHQDLETGAEEMTDERRRGIITDATPSGETQWSLYNDVTAAVWHDEGNGDLTKQRKFRDLHRVMPVADGVV